MHRCPNSSGGGNKEAAGERKRLTGQETGIKDGISEKRLTSEDRKQLLRPQGGVCRVVHDLKGHGVLNSKNRGL